MKSNYQAIHQCVWIFSVADKSDKHIVADTCSMKQKDYEGEKINIDSQHE